ncbi:MAG: hypothetical protein ACHQF0_06490 [Chitinophagales bacterium]
MNRSDCKYFCLLKGDWQKRFFELIELFQISLHKKFSIGVPENINNQYNRIIVYGISSTEKSSLNEPIGMTDEEIFDSFYKNHQNWSGKHRTYSTVSDFEKSSVNFFESQISYN